MSYGTDFVRLLIALFVLLSLFAVERTAFAAVGVFGGRIVSIVSCDCPAGASFIRVGPPRAKSLMHVSGKSKVYKYGSISVGKWAFGTTESSSACLKNAPKTPCSTPVGTGEVIKIIGTSQ